MEDFNMQLMTKEIEEKLEETGLYPDIENLMKAEIIVKYFNPTGVGTWLIVGGERVEEDWELFGYVELGYEWEWGPVMLSELSNYKGPLGLGIERDLYCIGKCVEDMVV